MTEYYVFLRKRPSELVVGDVFFHGYGWGRYERRTVREHDIVVHYRDTGARAKKRSVRCENQRQFIVASSRSDLPFNERADPGSS